MTKYDEIVNLAARRSLFYPASEIYANAPAGLYDYGPFGTTIKRKIVETWRKNLVQKEDFLEIDGAIAMPESVFRASRHITDFNDPVTQCKTCNNVFRADRLLEETTKKTYKEAMPISELTAALKQHKVKCPSCKGELMDVRKFNMLVKADFGVSKTQIYLRPETCQTIFTNWDRMVKTMRIKLPKGISQHGKVFRNEISPRQTLLRQVEFSQIESEIFFDPDAKEFELFDEIKNYNLRIMRANSQKIETISAEKLVKDKLVSRKLIAYYLARTQQLFERFGVPVVKMRFRELDNDERAFYAKEAWDFEVETSIGWLELAANNNRTDYDLKRHSEESKKDLSFMRDDGSKFIPHIWEISIGLDRTIYAVLELAYRKKEERTWLSLPAHLAPLHAGVFPLLSNKSELVKKAKEVYEQLKDCYELMYDETGSIGKRYARLDEIGVPFCITIDFDSLTNNDVTIRARDSSAQKRFKINELQDVMYKLVMGRLGI